MTKSCECNPGKPRMFGFSFNTTADLSPDQNGQITFPDNFIDTRRASSAYGTAFNFGIYDPTTSTYTWAHHNVSLDVATAATMPGGFDKTVYCVQCEGSAFGTSSGSTTSGGAPAGTGGNKKGSTK